jgi:hypothetical protein
MENSRVSYNKRTFNEIKLELISLVQEYYPEVLKDFTDSSVGSMLIDLNAGVANNLSVNTDRAFQETQLEYAQQRESILGIAKNLGFNIPSLRPSVTVVDFTVAVPVRGDQPDESYYPTLLAGAQVVGGGQVFETTESIDWNSPLSNLGDPNRSIIPQLNSNGIIIKYLVTKREVVINGSRNIYRKTIRDGEVQSFYKLRLPDPDVTAIEDVILVEGTNFTVDPTEVDFNNPDFKYYEVDYLAQQRVFVDDPNGGTNVATTGNTGIKVGLWIDVNQKFIKEFTSEGLCELTFGAGNGETDAFKEGFLKAGVNNRAFLDNYLENTALGQKLRRDSTIFVRYRTGGGIQSNVGIGVLTQTGTFTLNINGSRQDFNQEIRRSFTVNNPIPAIGGNDGLSIEQIRNLIKYNFSSQYRAVNITDYLFHVYAMNGRYGSPFRANAFRENNKVIIPILGIDSSARLNNVSNSLLKSNISEYLSNLRMVNDYVEIRNGRIFNLAFNIEVFVTNQNQNQIANSIIQSVISFFNINDKQMNQDIYITPLIEQINNVEGVVNVLSVVAFNKVGGQYSLNPIEQTINDFRTGQIELINQTIYSTEDSMFEIKFPERDIKVIMKKKVNLSK